MTKNITIVAVDTYAHDLTKLAIEKTLSVLPCQEVVVLSDRNIFPDGRWVDINPISIEEYNMIMIKHLWPLVRTEHILVVQYDGLATDSAQWSDDFLNYDYIGAVWPWPHHPPGFKVGNGGFSLRSKKLLHTLKDKRVVLHENLPMYEDLYVGVHYKPWLTEQGIRIANEATASKFSHEHHPGYQQTFGFHGTFNVPYYLDDDYCSKFIDLLPSWNSEGTMLMVAHCFQQGKIELGKQAIDQGRRKNNQFDLHLRQILSQHANQFGGENFKTIYTYIK